jgi:hypothetical protein
MLNICYTFISNFKGEKVPKIKKCDGFLACRTTKAMETEIKAICDANNREVSEVLNYLCRIFISDVSKIKTKFLNGGYKREEYAI